MNQTKVFFLCFSIFVTLFINAQNTSFKWSPKFDESLFHPINLIKKTDQNYVFLSYYIAQSYNSSTEYFDIYDENGALKLRKKIEYKVGNIKCEVNKRVFFEDKILTIVSHFEEDKKIFYLNYVDFEGNYIDANWKQIDAITKKSKKDDLDFSFFYFESSKKLYAYKSDYIKENDFISYSVNAYDENLDVIFKKKIILPYKENKFKASEFYLDNNERGYITGIYDRSKPKKRKGKNQDNSDSNETEINIEENGVEINELDNEDINNNSSNLVQRIVPSILTFDFSSPEVVEAKELNIDLKGRLITSLSYKVLKNDRLLIFGFYNNGTDTLTPLKANGMFTGFYDLNSKSKPTINLQKFDEDFLKRMSRTDKENQLSNGIPYLNINNIFVFDDESFMISGDDYHVEYIYQIESDMCYSNDIYNIKFDKDGVVEWFSYIPKYQYQLYRQIQFSMIGYSSFKINNKIYFFYYDNVKNYPNSPEYKNFMKYNGNKKSYAETSKGKRFKYFESELFSIDPYDILTDANVLIQASIDINGEIKRKIVYGAGDSMKESSGGKSENETNSTKNKSVSLKQIMKENRMYRISFARGYEKVNQNEILFFGLNQRKTKLDMRLLTFKFDD